MCILHNILQDTVQSQTYGLSNESSINTFQSIKNRASGVAFACRRYFSRLLALHVGVAITHACMYAYYLTRSLIRPHLSAFPRVHSEAQRTVTRRGLDIRGYLFRNQDKTPINPNINIIMGRRATPSTIMTIISSTITLLIALMSSGSASAVEVTVSNCSGTVPEGDLMADITVMLLETDEFICDSVSELLL